MPEPMRPILDEVGPEVPRYMMADAASRGVKAVGDFMGKPFGYDNPPGEILSNVLGLPAISSALHKVAYGQDLTTGRGQTLHLAPDVEDAALSVAPIVGKLPEAAAKTAETLGPKAATMAEDYLRKQGLLKDVTMLHSSPHNFEKFSSEHIGKGEGNQVYGQGLYFTDSDEVHKYYNKMFVSRGTTNAKVGNLTVGGEKIDPVGTGPNTPGVDELYPKLLGRFFGKPVPDAKDGLRFMLGYHNGKFANPINKTRDHINKMIEDNTRKLEAYKRSPDSIFSTDGGKTWVTPPEGVNRNEGAIAAEQAIDYFKAVKQEFDNNRKLMKFEKIDHAKPAAHTYKIDFADEQFNKMMKWEEPLSKQPQVLDIAKKHLPEYVPNNMRDLEDMTGEDFYHVLSINLDRKIHPENAYSSRGSKESDAEASRILREEGVPGHAYKTGFDRKKDTGKRNYVIYPGAEEHIQVLEKGKYEKQ